MRFTEACLLKNGEQHMTTLSEPLVTPKYGEWRQLVPGPDLYGRHLRSAICLDAVDKTPGRANLASVCQNCRSPSRY